MRRRGTSAALVWPARERWTGDVAWLSVGQATLLLWCRQRLAHGKHTFTIDEAATATGLNRSNVSRGLDRLSCLSLLGRKSTRGRLGRTLVWAVKKARALAERPGRLRWPHGSWHLDENVATSTTYGGFLSREAYQTAAVTGQSRRSVRRLTPPRRLYDRCPAGHRVRVRSWWHRLSRDARRLDASWRGRCRRCGLDVELRLGLDLPESPPGRWESAGTIARRMGSG